MLKLSDSIEIFEKYLPVVCKRLDRLNDERRVKITLRDREVLTHSYPVPFISPTAKSISLTNERDMVSFVAALTWTLVFSL